MTSTLARAAVAATLLAVLTLAGCTSTPAADESSPPDTSASQPADEATDEPTDDGAASGDAELAVAETSLGEVVVDGEGMTLYMFTNDTQDSGESVCEGDCLVAWPPLEGEPTAGEGVDESLLGTIERSDGSMQASYNGWPLYYWAQDTAPGDVTGQGVGDVWYVLDPAGEPIGMP